jgi:RNA-binding protein YlmH
MTEGKNMDRFFNERHELLKMMVHPEEKLEFAKILDNARLCFETSAPVFSDFLDPYKTNKFMDALQAAGVNAAAFGGYDESERKMIGVSPSGAPIQPGDFPIAVIVIKYKTFGKSLSHRDFLGAIVGLGLSRANVGDIAVGSETAKAAVCDKIAGYIADNLTKVSSVGVKTSIGKTGDIFFPSPVRPQKKIAVPSLRLDAVISEAFGFPRTSKFIKKTLVNWLPAESASKPVKEKDVITVRGAGRVEIAEISPKKDGFSLKIIVY